MNRSLVASIKSSWSVVDTVVSVPVPADSLFIEQHHADAKVVDPISFYPNGIAEFKCPFTHRDKSPQECCHDPSFSCKWENGDLHLKRNHQYFHQVQLQLYVGSDLFSWCDFCVYTPVDVAVERIYPSKEWQSTNIPELENYFDRHMLPDI